MDIDGRTALVTGANRGIGRAIAEALVAAGAEVLAGTRELDAAHEVDGSPRLRRVRMDLSSPESIEECFRGLGEEAARVDLLVNNAGVFTGGLLEAQEMAQAYEVIQVNLAATIHLTRLFLPEMLRRDSGKIAINASIVAHAPFPGATTYAASKAGLHGFSESLRRELDETGVSVLELVTPGVDTDMMDQVQREYAEHSDPDGWGHVTPEDWAEQVVKAIEDDRDEAKPGGAERIAQVLPKSLLDAAAKAGFKR